MSETPTPTTETATAITTPETPTTVGGWVEFLRNKIGSRTPEEIAAYEARIAEDRDREARESRRRAIKTARSAGIPCTSAAWVSIEKGDLIETKALEITRRWLKAPSERRFLALIGTPGVGKTVAAGWAAAELAHRGVAYVRERQITNWFRRGYEREIERIREAGFVVMDEMGTAPARDEDAARMAMLELLDLRIAKGRTMLIGNLDRVSIRQKYDARIIDRLRESGAIVECDGQSLRAVK